MLKKILITSLISFSAFSFSNESDNIDQNVEIQSKIATIMEFYIEKAKDVQSKNESLEELKENLKVELEALSLAKIEIEIKTNLIDDLFIDIKDTKNLYFLEFDEFGNIKKEIKSASNIIQERLGSNAKSVKVRLKDGSILPLIKYEVKKNDTLKKILLKTYPSYYKPSWSEISKRINTLVNINKNIIKMNFIYPTQEIYVPIFKDNPSKEDVEKNKNF